MLLPIPVAVPSTALVCNRLIVWIAGSYSAEGMDVRLLCLLRVVHVAASATSWSLLQRNPTEGMCLIMWDLETSTVIGRLGSGEVLFKNTIVFVIWERMGDKSRRKPKEK